MRKPTKEEVLAFKAVCLAIRPPKTESGLIRVIAKFFHCSSNDIKQILGA